MDGEYCMDHIDSSRTAEKKESPILKNSGGDLHDNLYIYRDDIVKSSKRESVLGIVMEVPGDTGSDSSFSDDSGSDESENDVADPNNNGPNNNEDGEKNNITSAGQARIMWFDGSETTNNLDDVCVVDRGFMHGDIVSLVTDPTGQLGLVLDVNVTVDLLSPAGGLIKDVSSRYLKRFQEFTIGDYVVCGSWLGRVDDMVENVTVLFDDGSVCKVMKADPSRLKPVSKSIADDSGFPYYPGQRVRAASSSVFKSSRWLSGLWKANRLEGTVTKVQAGSLFIYWIASASLTEGDNRDTVPAEEQSPKDVTLLSCFSHASWQLGDWCLFSGATTKDIDNDLPCENKKCLSLLNNDLPCENECIREVKKDLESHYLENGFTTNPLPDESIGGITVHMQPATSDDDYVAADMAEETGLESSSASLEPQSCAGTSSCGKETNHENWPAFRKKHRKLFLKREKKGYKRAEVYEKAFVIANITTKVDVAWQDGTRKLQLDSRLLLPINNPGEQDFFPEQYVIEKDLNENENEFSLKVKRVGVVKSINAKERIACVRWLKPVSRPEDLREFDKEEMVSVYELDSHPDYDYCYGDVVVRLSPIPIPSSSDTFGLHIEEQVEEMASRQNESEMSVDSTCHDVGNARNYGSYVDVSGLSWVGHITGLNDGDIEVAWGDGMVSKVGPQAIYVVGREGDEASLDGGSESSDGGSWETVEENEPNTLTVDETETALPSIDSGVKGGQSSESTSVDVGLAQNGRLSSAISFVTSLASGFFSQGRKQIDPLISDKGDLHESKAEEFLAPSVNGTSTMESSSQQPDISDSDDCTVCAIKDAASMINDEENSEVNNFFNLLPDRRDNENNRTDNEDDRNGFKHFDIGMHPTDHYFLCENEQFTGGKKWVKKVQQEWNIVEKSLPDEVFVRVFEDRMDLLRAVIVGACGTPYQDGLFFFDFHLPLDFPQVPPSAYYHSGGLRVNPNLYENGKVCLSLLNTWNGKGNEVWDPSSSSILQILVSIQGLVLNSKPYFNEAGYEKQIGTVEGEKNYLPYNENTFLLNLKSMTYLLRNPPMHFEEFVKDHFRRRGQYILKACDAYYSRGCAVGSLTQDACPTEASTENSCSGGFKLMLEKLMPKLVLALNDVGADCHQFECWRKS